MTEEECPKCMHCENEQNRPVFNLYFMNYEKEDRTVLCDDCWRRLTIVVSVMSPRVFIKALSMLKETGL